MSITMRMKLKRYNEILDNDEEIQYICITFQGSINSTRARTTIE
jgi:hypothetical protein